MSRAGRFKQADVQRALRAARAAGLEVGSYEITPEGAIRVLTRDAAHAERDELAEWRARRDARKAQRA